MTDPRAKSDIAATEWRAVLDALDGLIAAIPNGFDGPLADEPVEIDDVRRLIWLRLADRRRDRLPSFWVRRGSAAAAPGNPWSAMTPSAAEASGNPAEGGIVPPLRPASLSCSEESENG
jgi:hypothetical protein